MASWITLKAIGAFVRSALNYEVLPSYDFGRDTGDLPAWEDTPEFVKHARLV